MLQLQCHVGAYLGVPLGVVRSMSDEEFNVWLSWINLENKRYKDSMEQSAKQGKSGPRGRKNQRRNLG